MGYKNIRLGSSLTFNEETEADVINTVEKLSQAHKLGEVIGILLRIMHDKPEALENHREFMAKFQELRHNYGWSLERSEFFTEMRREVEDMQIKVNEIHDMCSKMYTLISLGKKLGAEEKVNNIAASRFVVNKQLKQLKGILGIEVTENQDAMGQVHDMQTKAEEMVDYILETYSDILEGVAQAAPVTLAKTPEELRIVGNTVDSAQDTKKAEPAVYMNGNGVIEMPGKLFKNGENLEGEEILDFGEADMGQLSRFFGGM